MTDAMVFPSERVPALCPRCGERLLARFRKSRQRSRSWIFMERDLITGKPVTRGAQRGEVDVLQCENPDCNYVVVPDRRRKVNV